MDDNKSSGYLDYHLIADLVACDDIRRTAVPRKHSVWEKHRKFMAFEARMGTYGLFEHQTFGSGRAQHTGLLHSTKSEILNTPAT